MSIRSQVNLDDYKPTCTHDQYSATDVGETSVVFIELGMIGPHHAKWSSNETGL